jgi:hypothetical protein
MIDYDADARAPGGVQRSTFSVEEPTGSDVDTDTRSEEVNQRDDELPPPTYEDVVGFAKIGEVGPSQASIQASFSTRRNHEGERDPKG